MRKKLVRTILIVLALAVIYGIYFLWNSFPILTGYNAKLMCSGIFVSHRSETDILHTDLSGGLMRLAKCDVNYLDSTVTASVWGMARQKAIYRCGLGSTLVSELSEEEIRAQRFPLSLTKIPQTDSIPWPLGDVVNDSVIPGLNYTALQKAGSEAMNEVIDEIPAETYALLVIYNNQIVFEKYGRNIDKHTKLLGWSMAKSITSTLLGIMNDNGMIKTSDYLNFSEWEHDARSKITLEHVLQQCSGLDFIEEYGRRSSVTNMLFRKADMGKYTASHSRLYEPGTVFSYTSGNTNMLCRYMQNLLKNRWHSFPYDSLFYPLGMYHSLLERDASGNYVGSSYIYASARDYARFGLLYCNNGMFNGKRILSSEWIQAATLPAKADAQQHYGYQIWLNGFTDASKFKNYIQKHRMI
jgi:hypothetical protein